MADSGGQLEAPDGFEWVEVGAYGERQIQPDWIDRSAVIEPHAAGWWDGRPYGAVVRGHDPLTESGAWERLYVLRPLSNSEGQV